MADKTKSKYREEDQGAAKQCRSILYEFLIK